MRSPAFKALRLRSWRRAAAVVPVVLACALANAAPGHAATTPRTIVTLGFDDGFASAYATAEPMLAANGMDGTFFIISDEVGQPNYMTWSQISALAADGNEIAGHTLTHPDLATLSDAQVRQEVCGNRADLLSRGFDVTDFAYPFGTIGTINATDEQIAQQCGYNSARTSLWYGEGCPSPCTESLPPGDPYWTTVIGWGEQGAPELEAEVTAAEATGGWAQVVFHNVCDPTTDATCDPTYGVTEPATLSTFLGWLSTQVADGSVAVRTVQQVVGGSVKPLVEPPALSGAPPAQTSSTAATIGFSGESDATFACSLDGSPFKTCTSPDSLTGLAGGSHTFAVEQTDTNGDVSTAATTSWTVDLPPGPPTLSGVPPALTNATSASISLSGESGATFKCSLDGAPYATCTSPHTLTGLTDGAHSFAVTQTNGLGQTSPPSTASWTIDTVAPSPVLADVPAAQTTATSASISFSGASGATFKCSLDGAPYAPCGSPRTLTGLAAGPHSLAVEEIDVLGNVSAPATASWTVEPPVVISSEGAGADTSPSASTPPLASTSSAPPPALTAPDPQSSPSVLIDTVRTVIGSNGDLRVAVACRSTATARCVGSVTVVRSTVAGAARRAATVLGRARYVVEPGKRVAVSLHLSKRALAFLARRRILTVTIVLRGRNGYVAHIGKLTLHAWTRSAARARNRDRAAALAASSLRRLLDVAGSSRDRTGGRMLTW